ncbi:hypothetical protein [Bauldia litoralis]|uniref:hypothetical protein n=1 Tax=Bauldia litoralis TaxID=665467 RepID=UPI003267955E
MRRADNRQVAKLKTHIVAKGRYGVVRLSDEAKAAYDALRKSVDETRMREAVTIRRYFDRFAEHGPRSLDMKMFKALGKLKDGTGGRVQLFEFKAYQWRVYGVMRHVDNIACFVGLGVDANKKKDKADPALMSRCAKLSSEI